MMFVLKKLLAASCVTVALGVACELALRLAGVVPSHSVNVASQDAFENQPGFWAPDQDHVSTEVPSIPFSLKTNSVGYRGSDFEIEKSPDQYRMLVVGDSFVFGNNVNETETLPYQLQQELNQSCKDRKILSINAGIPGSTIRGQAEMIRRGMRLNPDAVILVFTETDILDLANPLWDQFRKNRDVKARFPVSTVLPLIRETSIYAFLAKVRNDLWYEQRADLEDTMMHGDDQQQLRASYLTELDQIASELADADVTLVLVTYPGNHTVRNEAYDDTTPWAMREFSRLGVPTVELLSPLQKAFADDVDSAYLLPVDGHPSKLGYQVAAAEIAQTMLVGTSLQETCAPTFVGMEERQSIVGRIGATNVSDVN